jgi:uncharacterized protein (TIGR02246 family)
MGKLHIQHFSAIWVAIAVSAAAQSTTQTESTIIALERAALDRWGKGDPQGYLETYAPEVTYFDPANDKRVDGLEAMKQLLSPLSGKIKVDRYEMLGAKVQQSGDMAVLSYNLISHFTDPKGKPGAVRWNSTAVYRKSEGKWRIIHSHWSFTKPELGSPQPE